MTSARVLLLLFLAICTATVAHAQPAASGDAAARAHFDQAQAFTTAGNYAAAYREFEAGYKANPRPAFLFNMGETARAMGDAVKARAAYERFLTVEPSGSLATTARQRLVELGPPPVDARPAPVTSATPLATVPAPRDVVATMDATSSTSVVATPKPAAESRPLWKKWPLWAAIGGAVVAGVVVGVVATREGATNCTPGAGCVDLRH